MKLSILFLFISLISFSQDRETLQFYFETDAHETFTLSEKDQKRLDNLYKESRILAIIGHCDSRGSVSYNLALSKRRMEHVKKYLVKSGFDVSKASKEAMGESEAESSGLSLDKCRRVDVIFIDPAIEEEEIIEIPPVPEPTPPVPATAPPVNSQGLSKSAIEQFMEDDTVDEMEFALSILFVNVSTRVLDESKPQMFELLEIMQNNPSLNATFHGHVCCQPHPDLAEGRARAVALFLREYGISADRIDFVGHSNNQPKVWPELTDEDRKQNRRVAVVFTKSDE